MTYIDNPITPRANRDDAFYQRLEALGQGKAFVQPLKDAGDYARYRQRAYHFARQHTVRLTVRKEGDSLIIGRP